MDRAFSHGSDQELSIKREFLALARRNLARSTQVEEDNDVSAALELSAALIYMNVADYLAEYIARGVAHLIKEASGKYYFGQIGIKPLQKKSMTIEQSITFLERHFFPNKEEIMPLLEEVRDKRNKLAHEILKTDPKNYNVFDNLIPDLATVTESLVEKVDEIQTGMPPKNLTDLLNSVGDTPPRKSKKK